jgi:hypothetical protein
MRAMVAARDGMMRTEPERGVLGRLLLPGMGIRIRAF